MRTPFWIDIKIMAGGRFEAMIRQRWRLGEVNTRLENMMQWRVTENEKHSDRELRIVDLQAYTPSPSQQKGEQAHQ
jgi:hypothetical protein